LSYTSYYMHPTSDKKVFGGKWWRFARYEVKDGYIRPIEGLPLRSYEPWEAYHTPHGKETRKQPYHSLLELVSSIDRGELDPDERDLAIVDWCGKYGLLGVILLIDLHVPSPAHAALGFAHDQIWHHRYLSLSGGTLDDPTDASVMGQYVPNYAVFPVRNSSPHFSDPSPYFFPKCDFFLKPPPRGETFQREYSEPIETFLAAGRLLREVVEQLQATRDSKKKFFEKQAEFSEKTKLLIESLVSTVRPIIHLETTSHFGLGWDCGSLWSNFAMMAVLDFTNSRPLICRNSKCGAFFVSKSTEAKYCSRQCRGAVQIRKYRAGLARKAKGKMK